MRSGLLFLAFLALARLAHSGAAQEGRAASTAAQIVQLRFVDSGDDTVIALFSRKHVALDKEGYGEIDFATATGKLLVRWVDERIVADANGDGRIDDADGEGVSAKPSDMRPLKVRVNVGGRGVSYPLATFTMGGSLVLAGQGLLEGEFKGLQVLLVDANLNGVFGEAGKDVIFVRDPKDERRHLWGPTASVTLMGRVLGFGEDLYLVRTLDGGRALSLAPYEGEKARLELAVDESVVAMNLTLWHCEGRLNLQACPGKSTLLIPGTYRIVAARVALKLPPQKEEDRSLFDSYFQRVPDKLRDAGILEGGRSREPALIAIRPGENRLQAGPPFRLDFSAFVWKTRGNRLEVERAALVGGAGERYAPELGGAGRQTSSLKTFFRSGDRLVPSRRLDCGPRGLTGGPIRIPADVAADANAELVLRFEAPGVGRLTAKKKLSELPKSEPSLGGLTAAAKEAEWFGRYAEAIEFFEEAVRYRPDDDGLLNSYAWFLLTVKDEELRNAPRAAALARRAAELTREEAGYILDTLAEALYQTGHLEEAARYAAAAAEKDRHPEVQERAKRFREELEKKRAGKEE